MALFRGAHPSGVAEGNTSYLDMAHRTLSGTDELHKGFQDRDYSGHLVPRSPFPVPRHIIELVLTDVMVPLAELVEQLFGVGQIEGGGVPRAGCHG